MSIDPKELRLGNWLYGNDPLGMPHGQLGYFQVDAIGEDGINPWRMHEMDTEWASGEPIPITPEILEKAGFKPDGVEWWRKSFESHLGDTNTFGIQVANGSGYVEEKGNDGTAAYFGYPIKYLHQIQNIFFAISGEELPITL